MNVMATAAFRVTSRALCALAVCAFAWQGSVPAYSQQVDAYYADTIWTGEGAPINDAVLVVSEGLVLGVGSRDEVSVPRGAKRHELGAANLIPGLVVAQSNLVESTRSEEYAISPEVRAVDGFDAFADYDALLAAGITTVQISPGGNRLMPGQGAVIKLAGDDPFKQVLVESESLRFILTSEGLSPPTVYEPPVGAVSVARPIEPTKPQLASSLSQAIVGLKALLSSAADAESGEMRLLALNEALELNLVSRWTAGSNAEIQAALQLAAQFDLPWIIVDPVQVDLLTNSDLWKSGRAMGVILNPELRPGRITNPNVARSTGADDLPVWERAKLLIESGAGDKLALRAANDQDLEKLLYVASLLGRGGISTQQILSTITSNPAKMLGVGNRVGTLKPKADADFVVLSGTPLLPGTKLLATYADGNRVYRRESTNETASVVRAGSIYLPSGVHKDGSITISGGKISSVGGDVSLPKGAEVRDFGDAVIIPGMIDCSASLGLGGNYSSTVGLGTKIGPLLARDDDQVAMGRQGGVTTALLNSSRLPSPVLAFKLTDSPRPLKDPVALRFQVSGNLTSAAGRLNSSLKAGKGYAEAWDKYDADYAKYKKDLAAYEAAKKKYDAAVKAAAAKKAAEEKKAAEAKKKADADKASNKQPASATTKPEEKAEEKEDAKEAEAKTKAESKSKTGDDGKQAAAEPKLVAPKKPTEPKKPKASSNLEPYRLLFARKIPALIEVSDTKALELAVKVFRKEYSLQTAIVAGEPAALRASLLAENEVFVIVGPTLIGNDSEGKLLNYPATLAVAGADIGFQSKASTGVSELPSAISYAVYEGLGTADALAGLTVSATKFFGLDNIGSLAEGNDADLVVLSGPPLLLSTEVLAVMIDGKWVYEKESK